ncbi:hypothetical protein TSUD_142600 [Trifolium subterraneum]|uniref:Uncharacterized protein n=1 Tax=Trifolium subterraneum TaxID=3900 RepID=A0A2Z6MV39_TRISU|nr:hypothetical protein TSUD_142600 [Trifolium subterraneum]
MPKQQEPVAKAVIEVLPKVMEQYTDAALIDKPQESSPAAVEVSDSESLGTDIVIEQEQQAHLKSALVIEKEQQAQLAALESDTVPQQALSLEAEFHTTAIVETDEGMNTVHQESTLGNEPKAGDMNTSLKQVVLEDMEKIKHAWEQRDTVDIVEQEFTPGTGIHRTSIV